MCGTTMQDDAPRTRVFRSPLWMQIVTAVGVLLFGAAATHLYTTEGWSWLALAGMALVPVAIAGFLDALTSRIELRADKLVVVQNLRRREFARDTFVKATWGKGVPVSLERTDGSWLQLPSVGASAQGLANTLRAWLRT